MDVFTALADPTRRNILEIIAASGELSATDICKKFPVSPPAISQHLRVLREGNLIGVERRAQQRIYYINPEPMRELEVWASRLARVWEENFAALDKVLEEEKSRLAAGKNKGKNKKEKKR